MEGRDDSLNETIKLACVAGGLRHWARMKPDCRRGLLKAADSYSAQSNAALNRVMKLSAPTLGFRRVY